MKCGWCNKPDTKDIISPTAGETYGICLACLFVHYPTIHWLIYGDYPELIVDSREPDFIKDMATRIVTLTEDEDDMPCQPPYGDVQA